MTTEKPTPAGQPSGLSVIAGSVVWKRPANELPTLTGKYLVITSEGVDIVRVEESFMEYLDCSVATASEWEWWAEIPLPRNTKAQPDAQNL